MRVSIDQLIPVKVFSYHMTDLRVHSVLDLKDTNRVVALHHSFKQALIVIEIKRYF